MLIFIHYYTSYYITHLYLDRLEISFGEPSQVEAFDDDGDSVDELVVSSLQSLWRDGQQGIVVGWQHSTDGHTADFFFAELIDLIDLPFVPELQESFCLHSQKKKHYFDLFNNVSLVRNMTQRSAYRLKFHLFW